MEGSGVLSVVVGIRSNVDSRTALNQKELDIDSGAAFVSGAVVLTIALSRVGLVQTPTRFQCSYGCCKAVLSLV